MEIRTSGDRTSGESPVAINSFLFDHRTELKAIQGQSHSHIIGLPGQAGVGG